MTFLLDTHALLWWLTDKPKLSRRAIDTIANPANQIMVSSVSAWEIATKLRLGRLNFAESLRPDLSAWIVQADLLPMVLGFEHAELAGRWTASHKDPFDRMLAAQSRIEGAPLVTSDRAFSEFDIETVW